MSNKAELGSQKVRQVREWEALFCFVLFCLVCFDGDSDFKLSVATQPENEKYKLASRLRNRII